MPRARHRRPSRTGTIIAGTAPAAVAAGLVVSGPAAHAQVDPPLRSAPETTVTSSAENFKSVLLREHLATQAVITVHAGNTLSGIAAADCRNPASWTGIYLRNRKTIGSNPDFITPGEKLVLDCRTAHVNLPVVHEATVQVNTPRRHHYYQAVTFHGSGVYSFTELESLWVSAGGPGWAESAAAAVAECESGGRSDAYNPSGATGLWQILGAVVGGNLDNPYTNALNAVAKFKASGDTWAQWVCKP